MQLGELQGQLARFRARGASVVALSVDPPSHSRSMIRRMKLQFPVVSDQDQAIMQAYKVQNPDTRELALHAVFIVDEDLQIFYRKVASRRPLSQELLDAIDFRAGTYPLGDAKFERLPTVVAFPKNNFQTLIALTTSMGLPEGITPETLSPVIQSIRSGALDEATIAYRHIVAEYVEKVPEHDEQALLAIAAWMVAELTGLPSEARLAGLGLSEALTRQRQIRNQESVEDGVTLAVQQDLDVLRTLIRNNADRWKLTRAKTMLRSYRELSLAATR